MPVQVQQITGLRPWFEKRAQAASPPPKWKMALVTLTAVFPPVLLGLVVLSLASFAKRRAKLQAVNEIPGPTI